MLNAFDRLKNAETQVFPLLLYLWVNNNTLVDWFLLKILKDFLKLFFSELYGIHLLNFFQGLAGYG